MARTRRISVVSLCVICAMVVIVAWSTPTFGQPFTSVTTSQQRMSTGRLSIDQEIQLGNDYMVGHGVSKDEKQAAYWYEKAAEAGEPSAQKQIGFFYQAGIGVAADPVRAVHWYQLAAANGLVTARTNLGVAYLWGSGVRKDLSMAAQLFRQAAEKGDGRAATYLGNMYFAGNGMQQDKAAAEHWYRVGAKQHDPVAEFDLGALFSVEDHPHDFEKAAKWYRKSLEGGYVPAMHSLALLLEDHPELAKSDREFLHLFEQAAGLGQWKSSLALGMLFNEGKLVPRD
ncbi:MAG TPA: tetratricopeptide repeat protein, partial [Acidobacteriaceae bacterium]|nr:tetratricopeptide repeat protein [Acidobacteriaceae bacterium]